MCMLNLIGISNDKIICYFIRDEIMTRVNIAFLHFYT